MGLVVEPVDKELGIAFLNFAGERFLLLEHHVASNPVNNTRKMGKRRPPLLRLRFLALIVICSWAAYDYLHSERPQLSSLQTQHRQLESKLSKLQTQQQSLQKEKQQLNTKAYIEKYATEHTNLVMPNQLPFDLQKNGQHG